MTEQETAALERDIEDIRTLIKQAEHVVERIGKLIPNKEAWLNWRHRALASQLETARRDLRLLIDQASLLEVMSWHKRREEKRAAAEQERQLAAQKARR